MKTIFFPLILVIVFFVHIFSPFYAFGGSSLLRWGHHSFYYSASEVSGTDVWDDWEIVHNIPDRDWVVSVLDYADPAGDEIDRSVASYLYYDHNDDIQYMNIYYSFFIVKMDNRNGVVDKHVELEFSIVGPSGNSFNTHFYVTIPVGEMKFYQRNLPGIYLGSIPDALTTDSRYPGIHYSYSANISASGTIPPGVPYSDDNISDSFDIPDPDLDCWLDWSLDCNDYQATVCDHSFKELGKCYLSKFKSTDIFGVTDGLSSVPIVGSSKLTFNTEHYGSPEFDFSKVHINFGYLKSIFLIVASWVAVRMLFIKRDEE